MSGAVAAVHKAGEYWCPFTWLQYGSTRNPTTLENEPGFTDQGTLWGSLEELSGAELIRFGYLQSRVDCKIRLRNWPDVTARDRLVFLDTVYEIDSVRWGCNELICSAYRQAVS
jgi:SPP1 family predicted phage head-tail adaptor